MEDNPTQNSGVSPQGDTWEASGSETPEDKASEMHYELNLDEHAPADIDEAFKDAVAAVDRAKDTEHPTDTDAPSAEAPESAADKAQETPNSPSSFGTLPAETDGLRERLMRTLADFDNYRKRTEREKQTLRRFANFDVFKDFLGVLDNLERAMESSGSAEDLKQGLRMIVRQHEEILRRHGVERVESVNKAFDPTIHEAVARGESSEIEVPTVTQEMQKGYLLHDRLLRPAMVFVAMPDSKPGDGAGGDGEASS